MRIDSHVHVWQPHPEFPNPGGTIVGPHVPIPIELLDEYLEDHGIDRAVLVQPVYPGEENSYVADCARARPERYAAVCVVDPRQANAAERLAYWVTKRGCRGLRLRPRVAAEASAFGSPLADRLWNQAAELGIVISVLANGEHLAILKSLAQRFPSVPIVVDHLAHPAHPDELASLGVATLVELAACASVSLKLSGTYYFSRERFPYADCHRLFRIVLERFGPERLLWGSDFPHVLLKNPYGSALDLIQRALPDLATADRERILGGNALRLYWGE
ncbi:MAG: amidohydrolase family protein [Planctomycetales bacterium]